MSDWSAGYVSDIGYTFGYYPELNPLNIKLAFLNAGLIFPEIGTACELGFGQGLSANFHAAGSISQWHGTDFNPAQASFAQELAAVSGAKAQLFDESFLDFASRPDLPEFDFIGLHGIWSWVSDDNRKLIVDFIRRKLKVGGVLYVSYNTLPGWAYFAPMRHLMTEHTQIIGAEGTGIVSRINDAIAFADKLVETNPLFIRANPLVGERIKKLGEQNPHYLAHEYFNRDWHPMHFASMKQWLEPAKVNFACSASYLDHIDVVNLTEEQQAFLKNIPDAMFRESTRDFMVNQQFRKDYWVKGLRKCTVLDRVESVRQIRVILVNHRPDVSLKVKGALGEANMSEAIYGPILDQLADHKIKSFSQLEASLLGQNIDFHKLLQAIMILAGSGNIAAVQEEAVINKAKTTCTRLNAHLMKRARANNEIGYLVSPVTGGGYGVNRFQQLFLSGRSPGNQPTEWAKIAWDTLKLQGEKLLKEGKKLESDEDNLAELISQAEEFAEKQIPILKGLQIC